MYSMLANKNASDWQSKRQKSRAVYADFVCLKELAMHVF